MQSYFLSRSSSFVCSYCNANELIWQSTICRILRYPFMDYASSLLRIVRIILDTLMYLYLCWDYFAFQAIAFSYVNHF